MNNKRKKGWLVTILMVMLVALLPVTAGAFISGVAASGTTKTFNITAKDGTISMGDGSTAYIWGYASTDPNVTCPNGPTAAMYGTGCVGGVMPSPVGGGVQYPGPTVIVNQGDTVIVNLKNNIPTLPGNAAVNTSIVFPGQNVTAAGGVAGLLTQEAPPDNTTTVTYTFVASQPGTYTYYSGTQTWLQQEMGLVGALIVRPNSVGSANCPTPPAVVLPPATPTAPNNGYAYCVKNGYYDHEYLLLITEIDPSIHSLVASGKMSQVDNASYHATAWFIGGRNYPDTMSIDYAGWLPAQPYGAMVQMHPLENVLMRLIGGGRNLHPFHTHGQNHNIIARDGRLLQSSPAATYADMPISDYTTTTISGETVDAIWGPWLSRNLGWDIYGPPGSHTCTATGAGPLTPLISFLRTNQPYLNIGATEFDPNTAEGCADHGKDVPVLIPQENKLSYGVMYGGTPYIGIPGALPPIDPNTGGNHSYQNPLAGISFMWHSHSEKEITTNNIFIGGMATMSLVLPYTEVVNGVSQPINIP